MRIADCRLRMVNCELRIAKNSQTPNARFSARTMNAPTYCVYSAASVATTYTTHIPTSDFCPLTTDLCPLTSAVSTLNFELLTFNLTNAHTDTAAHSVTQMYIRASCE